jgi:hypothetical protein
MQVGGVYWRLTPLPPQCFPQPAHNLDGVSAHLVHSLVHRSGWYAAWRADKMSVPSATTV